MKNDSLPNFDARRKFLGRLGLAAATCAGASIGVGALGAFAPKPARAAIDAGGSFPTVDYDWTKHKWAFGVDATKCIGCLRCVESCPSGALAKTAETPGLADSLRVPLFPELIK